MDREGLIEHVEANHRGARAVCPICVSHSYGDPNYKTFLSGHLRLRHSFEMDDLIEDEEDEAAILRRVLELSTHQQ